MTQNVRQIAEQAQQLRDSEKLELVDELLNQLDIPDPRVEVVWEAEVARRIMAGNEGRLGTVSYEEVMSAYRIPAPK